MKGYLTALFSAQTPPPGSQEGLPYWSLWFLLCIILLLFAFIFLRDKDLRQRLNRFLFGAKKKLIRFRLQTRLKIAARKRKDLHRYLGQKIWEEGLEVQGGEKLIRTLSRLEEKTKGSTEDLDESELKIKKLKKRLEEISLKDGVKLSGQKAEVKIQHEKLTITRDKIKEIRAALAQKKKELDKADKDIHQQKREIQELDKTTETPEDDRSEKKKVLQKRIPELQDRRKETEQARNEMKATLTDLDEQEKALQDQIHEEKRTMRKIEDEGKKGQEELKKEIGEWERHRVRLQEKIQRIEKRKQPFLENLGVLADQNRIDQESLLLFYSQIDRNIKRSEEIKKQLQELD